MLDLEALPGLTRAERVQAVDAWLTGLLADAVAGTPPPRRAAAGRRPGPAPTGSRWSPSAASVAASCRRTATSTSSCVHEDRPEIGGPRRRPLVPGLGRRAAARPLGPLDPRGRRGRLTDVKAGLGLLDARLVAGDAGARRAAAHRDAGQLAPVGVPAAPAAARPAPRALAPARRAGLPPRARPQGGLRRPPRGAGAARRRRRPARRRADRRGRGGLRPAARRPRRAAPPHRPGRRRARPPGAAPGGRGPRAGRRGRAAARGQPRRAAAGLRRRRDLAAGGGGAGAPSPRPRYRRVRREPLAEGVVRQGDEVVLARDARPAADPGLLLRAAAAAARAISCCRRTRSRCSPCTARRCPSRGRRRCAGRSCGCWPAGAPRCRCWSSWTRRGCCPGCCPSGTACARCRSATPGTGSPSTATSWRRRRPPPSSPGTSTGPTCCSSPRCCTTSARAGRATTARPASRSPPRSPPAWASPPTTSRCWARWSATTSCCRPPPPGGTSTTRPRSTGSRRRSAPTRAVLQLLHALAQADGAATSASAWSPWKAHLVAALVARVQARLDGTAASDASRRAGAAPDRGAGQRTLDIPGATGGVTRGHRGRRRRPAGDHRRPRPAGTAEHLRRGARAQPARRARGQDDGRGGLRHRRVRGAARASAGPRCRRSSPTAMRAALEGTLPLAERLRQREADYRQDGARSAPPRISWHNGEVSGDAIGIVEVRAGDRTGLLYRLTAAIAGEGLDVTSARIETLGADAVDSFYVCNPSGSPLDAAQRDRVDAALVASATGGAHAAAHRPGARSTRRARSTVLSVARATVAGGTGRNGPTCERVPSRGVGPWTAGHGPARACGDVRGVRAASLRRRAHRRRRRVPRVGLRRLRVGVRDRRRRRGGRRPARSRHAA